MVETTHAGITIMSNSNMTLAEFERLLDIYGGDRARWPTEARAGAAQLVAREGTARRLLAEADALDRALERAPLPTLASEAALADRIVAAAQRSPRMVPSTHAATETTVTAQTGRGQVIRWPRARTRWGDLARSQTGRAAGLLAACLLFGVFIGLINPPQGMLPVMAEMTGLSLDSSGYTLTQLDGLDEDLI
jgi:hypothetical protein